MPSLYRPFAVDKYEETDNGFNVVSVMLSLIAYAAFWFVAGCFLGAYLF